MRDQGQEAYSALDIAVASKLSTCITGVSNLFCRGHLLKVVTSYKSYSEAYSRQVLYMAARASK